MTAWDNADSRVSWDFHATKAGAYQVRAEISGSGGGRLKLAYGFRGVVGVPSEVAVPEGEGKRIITLCSFSLPVAEDYKIELRPEAKDWKAFELHKVILVPKS